MIKKVGNWVFGSFFRTMGRFFFFLFFGFMLAMIISKNNISIKWTDLLGIETVKANEVGIYDVGYDEVYYQDSGLTQRYNENGWYDYATATTVGSLNDGYSIFDFWFNNNFNLEPYKGGYITIPFELNLPQVRQTVNSTIYAQDYCNRFTWGVIDSNNQVTRWDCDRVDSGPSSTIYDNEYVMPKVSINVNIIYNTGYVDICTYDNVTNKIICPITKFADSTFSIQRIRINTRVYYLSNGIYTYYVYLHRKVNAYSSAFDTINDNINSQTQQQQQQHNETMSTITDTNTTEADTQATNFFSNFSSQDNGGISSIITAPLSAISGLVSATCTPITLPIPYLDNKQLVLPCMSAIYQEHFGSFFTIYQTIIFGAIAYRIVVSIFMMIQGFKNPDDDKIEVVDL